MHIDDFILELNKKKERAWKKLYYDFYPALCAYSSRILNDRSAVEDIVQECLIKLWDSSLKFPDISALTAYLYRSVYNRSLNSVRDRANAKRLLQEVTDSELPDEDRAIELAIEEVVVGKLRSVIAGLSVQQRNVLNLSMEGLKVKEIAERLGISENTVKMQKKRAYAMVRERMGKVWGILLVTFFPNIF